MNIQQRLTVLERQIPTDTPLKPMEWTDGEYTAVVRGMGLYGYPKETLISGRVAKRYQIYINQILDDFNNLGITPSQTLIKNPIYKTLYVDPQDYLI